MQTEIVGVQFIVDELVPRGGLRQRVDNSGLARFLLFVCIEAVLGSAIGDVFFNGGVENHRHLRHHPDLFQQPRAVVSPDVAVIQQHIALVAAIRRIRVREPRQALHVIVAVDKRDSSTFAAARLANEGAGLTGLDDEVEVRPEHGFAVLFGGRVAEADVAELDFTHKLGFFTLGDEAGVVVVLLRMGRVDLLAHTHRAARRGHEHRHAFVDVFATLHTHAAHERELKQDVGGHGVLGVQHPIASVPQSQRLDARKQDGFVALEPTLFQNLLARHFVSLHKELGVYLELVLLLLVLVHAIDTFQRFQPAGGQQGQLI